MCEYGEVLARLSRKCRNQGKELHAAKPALSRKEILGALRATRDESLHVLEMAERPRPRPLRHVPGLAVARLPWKEIKTLQAALRSGVVLLRNWEPR